MDRVTGYIPPSSVPAAKAPKGAPQGKAQAGAAKPEKEAERAVNPAPTA